ncbi:unnamed protein product, partial [Linum tenue]
ENKPKPKLLAIRPKTKEINENRGGVASPQALLYRLVAGRPWWIISVVQEQVPPRADPHRS